MKEKKGGALDMYENNLPLPHTLEIKQDYY
jgi:hypothetical protein